MQDFTSISAQCHLQELSGWVCVEAKGLASITKSTRRYYPTSWDSLFGSILLLFKQQEKPFEPFKFESEENEGLSTEKLCALLDLDLEEISYFTQAHGGVDISECLYFITEWKLSEDLDSVDRYFPASLTLKKREILAETTEIRQKIYRKPTKS